MNTVYDYLEGGFRIFPLWPIVDGGSCGCGDPECETAGKHPRMSNWQHAPHWSDEQIEVMEQTGQLDTGFGVCLDNHLVIDIDERNGGFESYERLKKDTGIDYEAESGFVVSTGGGGLHIYFSAPEGIALTGHLREYKGIDMKSSGYVVGNGSLHRSGATYERKKGFPQDLTPAPQALIELLKKPERVRAKVGDNEYMDVSEDEIAEMLRFIPNDGDGMEYDDFVAIGMGVHDATQGNGFHLWDDWARRSSKYDPKEMDKKWQSFGKCADPVTLGTVVYHAEENGWTRPVVLGNAAPVAEEQPSSGLPLDTSSVDLLRPPGFVGDLTAWINDQCRYPRERLAVATALNCAGNIIGLRHLDTYNDITANTMFMCIAGSGTGKEAVTQAGAEIMRVAGMAPAVHGNIKSEQEIVRNVIKHQGSYYFIDELGYLLQKIENARKKGGASYLDGVVSIIMSIYTKASGHFLIGGDLKDGILSDQLDEIKRLTKQLDSGKLNEQMAREYEDRIKHISEAVIPSIDAGLRRPFLSMIGYTTPVSFDDLVTGEQATNGFISRCLLVREHETNPKRKKGFKPKPMPPALQARINYLHTGMVSASKEAFWRVEHTGDLVEVRTHSDAADALELVADWFEEEGERQKATTGLEAVIRRGYELVAKLSFIMGACDERIRTVEHVRWSFAFVVADMREKLRLAQTNILNGSKDSTDHATVLRNRILTLIGRDDGEPISVIKQRIGRGKYSPQDVELMVSDLEQRGIIERIEKQTKGRKSVRYRER